MLARIRIVLVSPSGSANVGAVCRAMANMGLSDLVLTAPRCDPRDATAVAYAKHGVGLLHTARVVPDLSAALADCVRTFATSSKLGLYRRQAAVTPAEAAVEALTQAVQGPVALVFGREDYGLRNEELLQFDRVVTIPADASYPVLNLAAAVMLLCYEVRLAWLRAEGQALLPMAIDPGVATHARKEIMFAKLFDALDGIGFFFGQNPDHLKFALRHLLGRVDLGVNEADILLGMARQIRWYKDHHPDRRDPAPQEA
ncbi:MAG: RNA methyltransferase [Phycisphaerales bacterium]|nr:RNA methyltransferase [Phycisphaerales bacterium]